MNVTKIIHVDMNGNVVLPKTETNHKAIVLNAKETSLEVDTGSTYGDIAIIAVIGAVVVGSFFFYGYFFGTRKVEEKVAQAVEEAKAEMMFKAYEPKEI